MAPREKEIELTQAEASQTDAGLSSKPLPSLHPVDPESQDKAEKKEKEKEKQNSVSFFTLLRFANFIDYLMMFIGMLGGLGQGMIQPLFIMTFGNVIDSLSEASTLDPVAAIDKFNSFILIMVYLGCAAFVGAYLRNAFFVHVGHVQTNRIRRAYITSVLSQEIAWFDSKKSGDLTTRLASGVPLIRDAISEKVGTLFYSIGMFVAGFIVSFTANWKVALVVLAGTPVLIVVVAFVSKFLLVYSNEGQKVYADAGSLAQEVLGAVKTVMVFGGQKEEERRYDDKLEVVLKNSTRKFFFESFGTSIPFLVGFSLYALAIWYGSTLVVTNELTTGKVFVAFIAVLMGSSGLGYMSPSITTISMGCGAAYEIFQVIDRKSEIDSLSPAGLKPEQCKGEISIKDVKFTYPSRPDVQVLEGISLEVGSGQTVALVGKSGSGKSTIIGLLERFYNPNEGTITLDGVPIADLNVKWLRSKMGIVGQEPTLFAGTIAENIAITKEDATMEEIVAAAKEANAHDFISSLPEGYNTVVYQKGGNLSGGQKQRIAIARALIKKPQILLLDEATSALDSKSERVVQDALEKVSVGRSTVVIAHRLSTIKNASCIHVFDQGTIIESGTHEQLMAKNGVYANMVQLQSVAATKENIDLAEGKERADTIDPLKKVASNKVFDDDDDEEGAKKKQRTVNYWYVIRKLFSEHWRHEWHFNLLGLFAGVLQGAVVPIFGFMLARAALAMMLKQGSELTTEVNFWSWLIVVLGAAGFLIVYTQNITFLNSGERLTKRLRYSFFSNVIRQKGAWFDFPGHEPAVFENILAQDVPLMHKASGKLLGQVVKILSCIGVSMAIGCSYSWQLALVILATVPLNAIGFYLNVLSDQGFALQARKSFGKAGVIATEAIENIRTVYSLTLEPHFLARYNAEILKPERKGKRTAHIYGVGFGFGEGIQTFVSALCFWYGGKLIQEGTTTVEGMFVTTMCVVNMGMVIGDTLHIFPDFKKALQSAVAYYEFMVQEPEIVEGKPSGQRPSSCEGNITFENVRFAYPTRPENEVLKGFSIKVGRGQTLALVGHSGCGKSTSVSILERIYSITSGRVLIDGQDVSKLDISWLRSQMGYVGQEPVVFARSLRENIVYGIDNVTEEQLQTAIKKANAYEFLSRLPDGLNTFAGERGTQLSGGQKQRIAIARALIRDPKILLLDEATSALDSESEKAVQEAINEARKGRTTIVIAHRLSTIKDADIIAVVEKGRVVEVGTHNELIEKQGAYFNFVQMQSLESA